MQFACCSTDREAIITTNCEPLHKTDIGGVFRLWRPVQRFYGQPETRRAIGGVATGLCCMRKASSMDGQAPVAGIAARLMLRVQRIHWAVFNPCIQYPPDF